MRTVYLEDNKDEEYSKCYFFLKNLGFDLVQSYDSNPEDNSSFSGSRQSIFVRTIDGIL